MRRHLRSRRIGVRPPSAPPRIDHGRPSSSKPRRGGDLRPFPGHDQGEPAAPARCALDGDRAPQQARQFARDRQAEPGAAIAAIDRAVRLAEGFEDDLVLPLGDADARILDQEGDAIVDPCFHRQRHATAVGELDRIRQQVLQDLLEALLVADHGRRRVVFDRHDELECLVGRQRREGALQRVDEPLHREEFRMEFQAPRLDPGQVEDVVDQRQQVVARAVDRLRELQLLGRQVAPAVLAQQLREDQRAVQRRAQLVRHVREEFGFVAARALQFRGTLLQRCLGFVERFVLAIERLRLLGQLRVRWPRARPRWCSRWACDAVSTRDCSPSSSFAVRSSSCCACSSSFSCWVSSTASCRRLRYMAASTEAPTLPATSLSNSRIAVVDHRTHEAQLDHAVDDAVVADGGDDELRRRGVAETGGDLEIAPLEVVDMDEPAVAHGLG